MYIRIYIHNIYIYIVYTYTHTYIYIHMHTHIIIHYTFTCTNAHHMWIYTHAYKTCNSKLFIDIWVRARVDISIAVNEINESIVVPSTGTGRHKGDWGVATPPLILRRGLWLEPPYFELVAEKNESTFSNHQRLFMGEPPIESMHIYRPTPCYW